MYTKINLSLVVLALTLAVSASAYDRATKATAMPNVENRPAPTFPVNSGPAVKQYDKPGIAALHRADDARRMEVHVSEATVAAAEVRTQRAPATDVSFNRVGQATPRTVTEYVAPARNSAHKPTYYSINGK
jgi:hypothetical protein